MTTLTPSTDALRSTGLSRRRFLQGAAAVGGFTAATAMGPRYAFATPSEPGRGDAVVLINLRGAADGLSLTPPIGTAFDTYRDLRPTLHITPDRSLPLDSSNTNAVFPQGMSGMLGLHPTFQALYDSVWAAGNMAIIPAAGFPDAVTTSRSHFESMRFWDYGTPAGDVRTGWMNRLMLGQAASGPVGGVIHRARTAPFRGSFNAFAVSQAGNGGLEAVRNRDRTFAALQQLHQGPGFINQTGLGTLGAVTAISGLADDATVAYPDTRFATSLKEVARILRGNVGCVAATVDLNNWDHHDQMGAAAPGGAFWENSVQLADGLDAFIRDLGPAGMAETTIIVLSEFGRTIDENGNQGTDHGRGGTMFLFGAGVRGGVFGYDFPNAIVDIGGANRRALPVFTDWRQPVAEIVATRTGVTGLFPGFTPGSTLLGVAR